MAAYFEKRERMNTTGSGSGEARSLADRNIVYVSESSGFTVSKDLVASQPVEFGAGHDFGDGKILLGSDLGRMEWSGKDKLRARGISNSRQRQRQIG